MNTFLGDHTDVLIAGTVENQVGFYDRSDHVVLLSAPLDVLVERVCTRPVGHDGTHETLLPGDMLRIWTG